MKIKLKKKQQDPEYLEGEIASLETSYGCQIDEKLKISAIVKADGKQHSAEICSKTKAFKRAKGVVTSADLIQAMMESFRIPGNANLDTNDSRDDKVILAATEYGCNKTKLPWHPHRNTMIGVRVLGCGPIRTGDAVAAQFNGGFIFWAKYGRRGDSMPWPNWDGRTKLDHLSWSKKSTISRSTDGGLFVFGESAVGQNSGPVCGNGNFGEYLTLGGG